MVLNEAPSEKNQHTWYSRLAQEHCALSVSVEEALVNFPPEEHFWLDNQRQQATVLGTGKRYNVFPPRLSLQSRSLPGTPYRVGTGLVNIQSNTVRRRTSLWTRFVHRLTALFAPLRVHSSIAPALPPIAHDAVSMQPAQMKDVLDPSGGMSGLNDSCVSSATTHEVHSKSECRVMTGMNARHGSSRSTQRRQRLAGRTTRICLEVLPAHSSAAIPKKEKKYLGHENIPCTPIEENISHENVLSNKRNTEESAFCAHNDTTSTSMTVPDFAPFADQDGTSVRLLAVEKATRRPVEDRTFVDGDRGTTSMRLPAVEKVARRPVEDHTFVDDGGGITSLRLATVEKVTRRREEPSPARRAGTGRFESGQRDVTISDPSVVASSVVLVTLIANPGPVVVQYVSLQPQTGFTLHLTAPTTMGAPFNYVVL